MKTIRCKLYVVDDEISITHGIRTALENDYDIDTFKDAESMLETIGGDPPDLVLLDIGLPGMNGIEALEQLKQRFPQLIVIMITAYEDVQMVISSMKQGAYDYILKPLQMGGVRLAVKNALESLQLRKEVQALQQHYLTQNLPCFIGESCAIVEVMDFIKTVAQSPDTPVLIVGETGTGKELLAKAVHYRSPNFKGPFVAVNCASLPRDLVESELFGYEKGAFSGADSRGKKGLIEEAADGTLFLDEIGDLNFEAQAKLLRFLEDGDFYRVGGTRKRHTRTRIVSATNKDVTAMAETDDFRKDLYFRLGVIKVDVPALNARREDIMPLATHFLVHFNEKFRKQIKGLSPEAQGALSNHNWTGNVRELKNMIERGALTATGDVLTEVDLGLSPSKPFRPAAPAGSGGPFPPLPPAGINLKQVQAAMERFYLQAAYDLAGGNESQAARLLQMNHHTYRYRRKRSLES